MILIITNSKEVAVQKVVGYLNELRQHFFVINTDRVDGHFDMGLHSRRLMLTDMREPFIKGKHSKKRGSLQQRHRADRE